MAESKQTQYTIGETVELPSKGLIYDKQFDPHISLRSMTARDEMKRQNPSSTQFRNLADIIEGCMIEKPAVHVYDMAIGDYEYKISIRCPHCGEVVDTVAHLDSLAVKDFDIDEFEKKRTIVLPKSGKTVRLKFQTPRMLDEAEAQVRELKRRFGTAEIAFDLLVLLKSVIDTVDGSSLEGNALETWINALPAMDMTKIVNSVDELNAMVGIDNKLFVDCNKCGGEVRTSFRYGPEFFRPTNI